MEYKNEVYLDDREFLVTLSGDILKLCVTSTQAKAIGIMEYNFDEYR